MRDVCGLSLLVNDYDNAIRFFCDKLALFRVEADADFGNGNRFVDLSFADDWFAFAINLIRASDEDRPMVGRQAGRHLLFSLPISDPDSMLIRLTEQSIETEHGIIELPYGCQIILKIVWEIKCRYFTGIKIPSHSRATAQPASDANRIV